MVFTLCFDLFSYHLTIKHAFADHFLKLVNENKVIAGETTQEWFEIHRPDEDIGKQYVDELLGHPIIKEILEENVSLAHSKIIQI